MKADADEQQIEAISDLQSKQDPTSRTRAYRDRLVKDDLSRFEICTTARIKEQVRKIAQQEGLTKGVAAEALLALGIASYLSRVKDDHSVLGLVKHASERGRGSLAQPHVLDDMQVVSHAAERKPEVEEELVQTPLSEPGRGETMAELVSEFVFGAKRLR